MNKLVESRQVLIILLYFVNLFFLNHCLTFSCGIMFNAFKTISIPIFPYFIQSFLHCSETSGVHILVEGSLTYFL